MKRILTAVILIPLVVALVLWGPTYLIAIVALAIAELAMWEFFRIVEACGYQPLRGAGYVVGAICMLPWGIPMGLALRIMPYRAHLALMWFPFSLGVILLGVAIIFGRPPDRFLGSVSSTLLALMYIVMPLYLVMGLTTSSYPSRQVVLLGLGFVWAGDTAAFFVGRAWGKHKLSPTVSPGKTWEGAVASLTGAICLSLIAYHATPLRSYFDRLQNGQRTAGLGVWEAILLAIAVNIAAQIGDLAESALKRNAGVKDSSNLVPGHGGVLDRIDALLFAIPVLWYYWIVTH